mmetsp:Transcript_38051/g.61636  ORF Transcript_38051/g.61636 Transcript_38051/m.61636 type:complete len:214 (-) Transcript_38051:209-850(-)
MMSRVLLALFLVAFSATVLAADPDPLSDFPPDVKSAGDLKFHLPTSPISISGPGGNLKLAAGPVFPGLRTQGLSGGVLTYNPCGIVEFHHHPRATEIFYVISGKIQVGIYNPATGQIWTNILGAGDLTVFPRGSIHFQHNYADGPTVAFAALNSENPGASFAANALSAFSNSAVGAAIGKSAAVAGQFKNLVDSSVIGRGSIAAGTCTYAPSS